MENKFHKNLGSQKWQNFSKEEQILNIAAEFSRTKSWLVKNNEQEILNCLNRAFELIDLTINDQRWQKGLKELLRFRDVLAEFYLKKNKNIDEFFKISKTLLNFNKFTSLVKI
ncbi:hypothetical protein KAS79_03800 [Candidatus Parcubacteria bacterium]|nr:hypothetical protein [Candidatus Parcubacteria bacterium]